MGYASLRQCVADLERTKRLVRIDVEIDPHLEAAEIQRRVYQAGGPALLNVGAGQGTFSQLLEARGFEVTSVDPSPAAVELLRESWLVEDRWWTAAPLRRRYWELVGERGRNLVVFHDLCSGRWFVQ